MEVGDMFNIWLKLAEEIDVPTGIDDDGQLVFELQPRKVLPILRAYWHHVFAAGHISRLDLDIILKLIDTAAG